MAARMLNATSATEYRVQTPSGNIITLGNIITFTPTAANFRLEVSLVGVALAEGDLCRTGE